MTQSVEINQRDSVAVRLRHDEEICLARVVMIEPRVVHRGVKFRQFAHDPKPTPAIRASGIDQMQRGCAGNELGEQEGFAQQPCDAPFPGGDRRRGKKSHRKDALRQMKGPVCRRSAPGPFDRFNQTARRRMFYHHLSRRIVKPHAHHFASGHKLFQRFSRRSEQRFGLLKPVQPDRLLKRTGDEPVEPAQTAAVDCVW